MHFFYIEKVLHAKIVKHETPNGKRPLDKRPAKRNLFNNVRPMRTKARLPSKTNYNSFLFLDLIDFKDS